MHTVSHRTSEVPANACNTQEQVSIGQDINCISHYRSYSKRLENQDFPGDPAVKTLHSQYRETRFDPWSGN